MTFTATAEAMTPTTIPTTATPSGGTGEAPALGGLPDVPAHGNCRPATPGS